MPWIYAAATVASTAINAQSQQQSSEKASRSASIQSQNQRKQAPSFQPTAQSSQQSLAPTEAMDFANTPQSQSTAPPPQTQSAGGGSNTLSNVNQAAQLGATLQQIFRGEQQAGQASRERAIAGQQRAPAAPFTPTAQRQMDPRLQQIMGR